MAHRSYSKARCGNLGFLPKSRCRYARPQIKSFPEDKQSEQPHLTGFISYKAGCTHVLGLIDDRSTDKKVVKQVVRQATVLDCPAMIGVGVISYINTPQGLKVGTCVWASKIGESMKRRFYNSKKDIEENKAFVKYSTKISQNPNEINEKLEQMKQTAKYVRLICHTQPELTPLGSKKAQIIEIQINGGNIEQKVEFAKSLLEKEIKVSSIFHEQEQIDTISITRGRGFEGVVTRWNVTRLPRKTRRGNRKVACIGSWHPANVQYTVARAGQMGYFHRTETNKIILKIGDGKDKTSCKTEFDTSEKTINPLGGWVNYGMINNEFVMIQGSCPGTKKRTVVLRQALLPHRNVHHIKIQWICTTSKMGHGMFDTAAEKARFYASKKVATK